MRTLQPIQIAIPDVVRNCLARITDDTKYPGLGVRAQLAEDGTPELHVFDIIGEKSWWDEDPRPATQDGVVKFLADNKGKDIRILINSPGGLAYEGIAMYNLLIAHHGKITTRNIGMAGSAASIILMAGDTVEMHDNATLFIHRALTIAIGNRDEMQATAEFLDLLDEQLTGIYAARTGKHRATIRDLLKGDGKKDGTFMGAEQAKKDKFIDTIIPSKKPEKKAEETASGEGDSKAIAESIEKASAAAKVSTEEMDEALRKAAAAGRISAEEMADAIRHESVRNRLKVLAWREKAAMESIAAK